MGLKEKSNMEQRIQLESINQKVLTKEGKLKRVDQTIQTKQELLKQRKKILPASRGRMYEDMPKNECKGKKTIMEENMGTNMP